MFPCQVPLFILAQPTAMTLTEHITLSLIIATVAMYAESVLENCHLVW